MADKKKLFLWEYTKQEQREIITSCTESYTELLGHKPKSFRAGKYSANRDTLDILNELGYKYDFSEFMGQRWCGIDPPITADKPCRYKNFIEFPVTVFKSAETLFFKRYDKLDMEMVKQQFNYVVDKYNGLDNNVISLFLHSFSFVKWRKNPDAPSIWKGNINKCRKALERIKRSGNFKFVTEDDLEEIIEKTDILAENGNAAPQIKVTNWLLAYYFLLTTAIRIFDRNTKARCFVCMNVVLVIAILIGMLRCI